ncbi:SPASM domain-containing protein [Paraoerskovia marina]|uniref:SPASM domain-containing protein n=1 Tax=Paraoerskovia marina TaxID=545619 RepID=UPI000ABBE0D7|nr:SPASM domain-containing protein [Paraoerskovia marina]
MSAETLSTYVRALFAAHPDGEVTVAWQGREPMLRGLPFFRRVVELSERYRRPGQRGAHVIQTNGTLNDDEWATFLRRHHSLQFIPIVERVPAGMGPTAERSWRDDDGHRVLYTQDGDGVTSRTVSPAGWGRFLSTVFDEWVRHDVGEMFVQHFDGTLGNYLGRPSLCVHVPQCGQAVAVEHNGDVYACDHYVEPDYRLGNITETSFPDLLAQPEQVEFGLSKLTSLPEQCRECPVRWACNGGCPKDRFVPTPGGEPGLNYLCEGYRAFFGHAQPAVSAMAELLRRGRPATDVMTMVR